MLQETEGNQEEAEWLSEEEEAGDEEMLSQILSLEKRQTQTASNSKTANLGPIGTEASKKEGREIYGEEFEGETSECEGVTGTNLNVLTFPLFMREHVDACSTQAWYKIFSADTETATSISPLLTIPTKVIPLSREFCDYLKEDGVFIPGLAEQEGPRGDYDVDSSSDEESEEEGEEDDHHRKVIPTFPELDKQIQDAIQAMGGSVFPKLTWTSPKDASWIAFGCSLECKSPADVYLLLKSSDFVTHDLLRAYQFCSDGEDVAVKEDSDGVATLQNRLRQLSPDNETPHYLVLKEWLGNLINPALEFRCFVRNKELIGICQRDIRNYYESLKRDQDSIESHILEFFEKYVRPTFPLDHYVFDIYCTPKHFNVKVVDFNPFSPSTDPLLFTWEELLNVKTTPNEDGIMEDEVEFRINLSNQAAQSNQLQYSNNRLPREAFDFSSNGGSMAEFAKRFNDEVIAANQI